MTVQIYRYIYRCVLRLHDLIYFSWIERKALSWAIVKYFLILAAFGVVIAVFAECFDALRPNWDKLKHDKKNVNTEILEASIVSDDSNDEDDAITVPAKLVHRRTARTL